MYICLYMLHTYICMYVSSHLWLICLPRSIVYKALSYTYLPHVNAHQIRSAWLMMILRLYTAPHTTNIPHRVGGGGAALQKEMGLVAPRLPRWHIILLLCLSCLKPDKFYYLLPLSVPVCVYVYVCVWQIQSAPHMQSDSTQPIWYGSYSTLNQSQGSRRTRGDRTRMSKIFWLICLVCILKDFHCMICTTVTIAINQGQNHNDTVNTAPNVLQLPFWHPLSSPLTGLRASRKACSNKTSVVSLFQLRTPQHFVYI